MIIRLNSRRFSFDNCLHMAVAEVSLRFKDPALLCIFKLSTLPKYTLCCFREVWLLRLKKWSKFEAGAWPIIGMKTGVAKVDISSLVDITALPLNPPYFDIFPLIITSAGGGSYPFWTLNLRATLIPT